MLDHWPRLPWAFPWALAICEEAWRQRALAGIESDPPPYVSAVATVLGTDAFALWDRLEGLHGWESHDEGYGQRVWQEAGAAPAARSRPHRWRSGPASACGKRCRGGLAELLQLLSQLGRLGACCRGAW